MLQIGQVSFACLFGCRQLRGPIPALLYRNQHSGSLQLSPGNFYPFYRFRQSPSSTLRLCVQGAFSDALCPRSVPVVLATTPSRCALSPWCLGFGLDTPQSPAGALGSQVERRLELLLQENSPKCPRGSFSFSENPPAQSCRSIQGRACLLTQPTTPTRLGTVQVRAPHGPALNSPQPAPTFSVGAHCPCVFATSSLFPSLTKQPGLSRCCSNLVWQGREPLTNFLPRVLQQARWALGLGL